MSAPGLTFAHHSHRVGQFEQAGLAGFFSNKGGAELLLQRLEIERLIRIREGGLISTRRQAVDA